MKSHTAHSSASACRLVWPVSNSDPKVVRFRQVSVTFCKRPRSAIKPVTSCRVLWCGHMKVKSGFSMEPAGHYLCRSPELDLYPAETGLPTILLSLVAYYLGRLGGLISTYSHRCQEPLFSRGSAEPGPPEASAKEKWTA